MLASKDILDDEDGAVHTCLLQELNVQFYALPVHVWLVLNWFDWICFSRMDLDYKLEPRPCLNSHMFPSCLYGDLFCYPTIWSVNCIFSYCTVVYLDVDAICIYCFCLHYSCTPSLPSAVCINFYSPVCSLRFAFCTDQIVIVIHVMYIELKKIMLWSIFFCVNLF